DLGSGAGSFRQGHFGRADLRVRAEICRVRRAGRRFAGARHPSGLGRGQHAGGRVTPMVIVVHDAEAGGYWAEVPAMPGCATQGESIEELMTNLLEAIEGYLS